MNPEGATPRFRKPRPSLCSRLQGHQLSLPGPGRARKWRARSMGKVWQRPVSDEACRANTEKDPAQWFSPTGRAGQTHFTDMNTEAPAGETPGPAPQESGDPLPGCHARHSACWWGHVRRAHSGASLGGWPSDHFLNSTHLGCRGAHRAHQESRWMLPLRANSLVGLLEAKLSQQNPNAALSRPPSPLIEYLLYTSTDPHYLILSLQS